MRIAVLGTGTAGQTVATRLVQIGHQVMMGSRTVGDEKAVEWVKHYDQNASHGTFADAARFGDMVINCIAGIVGFRALRLAGRENLKGKILIDVAKPQDFLIGMQLELATSRMNAGGGEEIQRGRHKPE
jgi:8-hydroxy-5-deazaflavin:NADPH oxidoreductase